MGSVLEIPSGRTGHVQTHQPAQILCSPLVQGASNSRRFNHHLFSTRVLGSVVDAENMNVTKTDPSLVLYRAELVNVELKCNRNNSAPWRRGKPGAGGTT